MAKTKRFGTNHALGHRPDSTPSPRSARVHRRRCPTCKNPAEVDISTPYFPFCSVRCQRIDLGRWLEEDYTIPGLELDADLDRVSLHARRSSDSFPDPWGVDD